jgi:leucyl aminopeptidase
MNLFKDCILNFDQFQPFRGSTFNNIRRILSVFAVGFGLNQSAFANESVWITIDKDAEAALQEVNARSIAIPLSIINQPQINKNIIVARVEEQQLGTLSAYMHQHHQRCGGFIVHNDLSQAFRALRAPALPKRTSSLAPTFNHQPLVSTLSEQLNEENILSFIETLSSFKNRYYSSKTGESAAKAIRDHWLKLANSRSDVRIKLINHSWRQPSVSMTIIGTELPEELIIIGGHLDSINQWMPSWGRAPGADDDASGIATLTEVARALLSEDFKPKRSIQFIGYAAEEVGLRGSQEIARNYRDTNRIVKAVMQLDMTNYQGSSEDIVFISDYTDPHLNQISKTLLDTYFPEIQYTEDRCGYACSDHSSWTQNNYPAVMPFEARMNDKNPHIHTSRDTLDKSGFSATHALNFAKLAVAFLVETASAP